MARWKQAGVCNVLSLLTADEESELDLGDEAGQTRMLGIEFDSFPIPDRQVPRSEAEWGRVLDKITRTLSNGKNVVVHCRQGIGRSGMLAACLLVKQGMSPGAAVELVSAVRGVSVPETPEQRDWIDHYAAALTATK